MYPTLLHLWGPFSIHSFGVMIVIGALVCLKLAQSDKKLMSLLSFDELLDVTTIIIVAGVVGARLLFVLEEPQFITSWIDLFDISSGGLSLLGGLILAVLATIAYLRFYRLPILKIIDGVSLYIPLLYGISRIGCFLAGCCYGTITHLPWAITYTDTAVFAPCYVPLHPTQLYSSFAGCLIFFILYWIHNHAVFKPGHYFGLFLILIGAERFSIDFLRADRIMFNRFFSTSQMIAAVIIVIGVCLLYGAQQSFWLKKGVQKQ